MAKKIPLRQCVGCGEMKGKKDMMRVLKTDDGICLDATGKKNGRGAYVCKNGDCCFVLKGAGWGHGVGLCQIGAAVMGEKGYTYDRILGHYYPGAVLEKI